MATRGTPPDRLLMGPGPSNVSERVLSAMGQATVGHLDPWFVTLLDDLKEILRWVFQTENEVTFPMSGPGSVGMEACFVNLVEPGDSVLVARNGVFGGRMVENVERCGGVPVVVDFDWGTPCDPATVERALTEHPEVRTVAFVHAETSTGVISDAPAIAAVAHERDCLVIADVVTSLGGSPVKIDEWEIDAAYSGTQKCLSCPPGLSPVTFNTRAVERIRHRKSRVQSWFMDLQLLLGYWDTGRRTYHHTAPVNSLYGLREALLLLQEEGLPQAWERHRDNYELLRAGLERLGIDFLVAEGYRAPQLNTVLVPNGVDEMFVRTHLLEEDSIEIGAGLGPLAGRIWRVGLMGHTSTQANVECFLGAFEEALHAQRQYRH